MQIVEFRLTQSMLSKSYVSSTIKDVFGVTVDQLKTRPRKDKFATPPADWEVLIRCSLEQFGYFMALRSVRAKAIPKAQCPMGALHIRLIGRREPANINVFAGPVDEIDEELEDHDD